MASEEARVFQLSEAQVEELRVALVARSYALGRTLADGRAPESVVVRKGAVDALLARLGQLRLVGDGVRS